MNIIVMSVICYGLRFIHELMGHRDPSIPPGCAEYTTVVANQIFVGLSFLFA